MERAMCDQGDEIPNANYTCLDIFRRQCQLDGSFETVFEKFPTCRARVTFQGSLVWFAHPVTFNVGAVLGHAMWCISAHNESECVRLISISGSVSKSN